MSKHGRRDPEPGIVYVVVEFFKATSGMSLGEVLKCVGLFAAAMGGSTMILIGAIHIIPAGCDAVLTATERATEPGATKAYRERVLDESAESFRQAAERQRLRRENAAFARELYESCLEGHEELLRKEPFFRKYYTETEYKEDCRRTYERQLGRAER